MSIHELHRDHYKNLGLDYKDPEWCNFDYFVNIDDKAIGALYYEDNYTEVVSIFVDPKCRQQGYGSKVMNDLHSKRNGIYRLSTYFVMQEAIKMYQKFGYQIVDVDGDQVIMEYNNGYNEIRS